MRSKWKVCSLGDTVIYLHAATLLFAAYMIAVGQGKLLIISIISIFLHEMGHCAAALLAGYPAPEIEITPLGALMRLDDELYGTKGLRLLMLAAGPMVSLLLCCCAVWLTKNNVLSVDTGRICFSSNLSFFVGNLLPVLPLDGGRILALLLSCFLPLNSSKKIMRILGTVSGLLFVVLNIYMALANLGWNLSCCLAGCVMIYAANAGTTSAALEEMRMLMDRKIRFEVCGALPCRWVVVSGNVSLRKALTYLAPRAYTMFLLKDIDQGYLQWVDEETLIYTYMNMPAEGCKTLLYKEKQTVN